MTTPTISLDKGIADSLTNGMTMNGAITLPFPHFVLWVLNGDAKLKAEMNSAPAKFFGGWACKSGDVEEAADQSKIQVPANFAKTEIIPSKGEGGSFLAYTARSVLVAPIAIRQAWVDPSNGVRYPQFTPGARNHVQALVYLAEKIVDKNNVGSYQPWGPVVLSAKGFQAKNLLGAFGAWDKHTKELRRKIAPDVPAWCFYLAIGTFGKDREQVLVGKGAQSPITPIKAYLPDSLTEEQLAQLFVGELTAASMVYFQGEASEWINAWKTASKDQLNGQTPSAEEYFGGQNEPPSNNDEIPF